MKKSVTFLFCALLAGCTFSLTASSASAASRPLTQDDVSADALNLMSLQCDGSPACADVMLNNMAPVVQSKQFQEHQLNPYGFWGYQQYMNIAQSVCAVQTWHDQATCMRNVTAQLAGILRQQCSGYGDRGERTACYLYSDPRNTGSVQKSVQPQQQMPLPYAIPGSGQPGAGPAPFGTEGLY